jgi:gamma-glutamylputrescine oxidase
MARDRMAALVADRGIACDLRLTGHLSAASFVGDIADFAAEAEALDRLGIGGQRLLGADEVAAAVVGPAYHGGWLDPGGGHVQPLAFVRGLAAAAEAAGAVIHEASRALAVSPGAPCEVETAQGRVSADRVILACDARIGDLPTTGRRTPGARRLMPVWSYTVATAPLGARAAALIPGDVAVSDTRFALDYYRRSADDRLLFSGGERYVLAPLADIAGFVRPHLARAFPALAETQIDHEWAGIVAVTTSRFPQVGDDGRLFWAHGYSGHGVLLAQAAGDALAGAVLGERAACDLLALLPSRDWPGGAYLRQPLYTGGMLYFSARDRLRGMR